VDRADALRLLRDGEVEVEGRMPWSSNATFLVTLRAGEAEGQAIYKPGRGERPLWDFPHGLYRREVAAWHLSDALGLGIVPPTISRDGPFGSTAENRPSTPVVAETDRVSRRDPWA